MLLKARGDQYDSLLILQSTSKSAVVFRGALSTVEMYTELRPPSLEILYYRHHGAH